MEVAEAAFLYSKLASALLILNPHCPESPSQFPQSLLWARTTAPRQDVPFGHFLVRQAVGPLPTLPHFHGTSLWARRTAPTSHIRARYPSTVSAPSPTAGGPLAYPPAPLLPSPGGQDNCANSPFQVEMSCSHFLVRQEVLPCLQHFLRGQDSCANLPFPVQDVRLLWPSPSPAGGGPPAYPPALPLGARTTAPTSHFRARCPSAVPFAEFSSRWAPCLPRRTSTALSLGLDPSRGHFPARQGVLSLLRHFPRFLMSKRLLLLKGIIPDPI